MDRALKAHCETHERHMRACDRCAEAECKAMMARDFPGLEEWMARVKPLLPEWRAGMSPLLGSTEPPVFSLSSPSWDWSDRGIDVREQIIYSGTDQDVLLGAAIAKHEARRITT